MCAKNIYIAGSNIAKIRNAGDDLRQAKAL